LNDDDNNVRYLAAWALGEIRDKRAVESLNQLLNDSDANVRETAKESMKKIRKSS
jgi:HEAT repeat protein